MNDYIIVKNEKSDYLAHHGIEKQKWGVRHGPPYPLDYEDHSKAQKKEISKYKFTSKKSQLPPKQRKGKDVNLSKSNKKVKKTNISSSKKFDKRWKEHGFLNDFVDDVMDEHDIAKGKSVVDALTKTLQVSGGKWYKPVEGVDFKYTDERDLDITNGNLNAHFNNINRAGGKNNCVGCSVAAELMCHGLRGVGASVSRFGNNTYETVKKYFDGYDEDRDSLVCNTVGSDIEDVLREKFGNNSSGILTGSRTKSDSQGSKRRTGGHAMHFTIDDYGNVEVQDAQSHKRYSSILDACNAEGFDTNFKNGTSFYNLSKSKPNVEKLVNSGLITTGWGMINGNPTSNSFMPYKSNRDYGNYNEARDETKKQLYEDYKQYKKENYWDKEDEWDDDDW